MNADFADQTGTQHAELSNEFSPPEDTGDFIQFPLVGFEE
jgi:hypothetical protein